MCMCTHAGAVRLALDLKIIHCEEDSFSMAHQKNLFILMFFISFTCKALRDRKTTNSVGRFFGGEVTIFHLVSIFSQSDTRGWYERVYRSNQHSTVSRVCQLKFAFTL